MRRLGAFLVFRLLPGLLFLAVIWYGYDLARSIARYLGEQNQYAERQPAYAATASQLMETRVPEPTGEAAERGASRILAQPFWADMLAQFVTNTPVNAAPVMPAFATNTPAVEPSAAATATPVPPTPAAAEPPADAVIGTPRPLPTVLFLGDPAPGQVDVTAIPTRVEPIDRQGYDLMNILLLGTDEELTGDNFRRTDTMIILSINRTTGSVAMLSLPRDLFVYIPAWSMQRLNLAWARGENGGWVDGPFELMRQTILYNFGINVHYYVLINLSGFTRAIDLLGGVNVAVDCAIQDLPLIGAEVPRAARPVGEEGFHVLDIGEYTLTGAEALWYARSRYNSSDFDRGRRQQQILRAVWRSALDSGRLTANPAQLLEWWTLAGEIVETNLRFEDIVGLAPIALNLRPGLIENFALVRTYHTTPWQPPSGDFVQLPVYETLRPLLEDFYRPPTTNQIVVEGAQIRVLNGTAQANWDRVAAGRLGWDGLNAAAAGPADRSDYPDTILIDYTGQSKGSSRGEIARILNIKPENIRIEPDPNRQVDFEVIVGSSYNSCTFSVLPVDG
jgi:LCP family protein required for cell wall assembly